MLIIKRLFTLSLLAITSFSGVIASADQLNVYSGRKESLIKPLLDEFSQQTGIKVNLITSKGDALLTRLKSEGINSPADILITSDAGRLFRAKQANVLQQAKIDNVEKLLPEQYRDSQNFWFGLSLRARVIVYNPKKVTPKELATYEDLASSRWKSRICVRSSNNIYNQSLVASLISHHGEKEAQSWLNQFVKNFAQPPKGGDRDQVKFVASGMCDVALVNSYYLGAMLQADAKQKAIAERVELFWPNQQDRGAHMNVSGIAVTASAKHKANAEKLIAFLLSEESQQWYADVNNEFPIRNDIKISKILEDWGSFKADNLAVEKLGTLNADAVKAMDRASWK